MSSVAAEKKEKSLPQTSIADDILAPVTPARCRDGRNSDPTSSSVQDASTSELSFVDNLEKKSAHTLIVDKRRPSHWPSWKAFRSMLVSSIRQLRPKIASQSDQPSFSNKPCSPDGVCELPRTAPSIRDEGTAVSDDSDTRLRAAWDKLVVRFCKNYRPRTSPPLVFPTPPSDAEKHYYVNMNRPFLLTCGTFALLAVTFGAWTFAKASPIYSWFALYVLLSESYLLTGLFITLFGKKFDLAAHREFVKGVPLTDSEAPTVDIFLTVCNEPLELIENTWKYITALQYPAARKRVYILDDGADEDIRSLARRYQFEYISRPDRPILKKAGNIRYGFTQTSGEYFVVFDADFCPRPEFLLESIPYLISDPNCALLQTPQFFRSVASQTSTEQGAGAVQEYIYRIMQPCRDRWGAAICTGSNAVFRRKALEAISGAFPADESEDIQTGFWVITNGWKLKFLSLNLACGTCPDTPRRYFSQQVRWCNGSVGLCTRREFWTSNLSVAQKICYLTSFLFYVGQALQPFLSQLPAPLVLWTRPDLFKYYNIFFAFPSIFLELIALRIWARGRYTLSVQYVHMLMAFSYLQSILDVLRGTKLVWMPTGGNEKTHKGARYRNMWLFGWIWTLTFNGALLSAIIFRILGGLPWYNVVPVLFINAFNLLCLHRFLLFRHPKD